MPGMTINVVRGRRVAVTSSCPPSASATVSRRDGMRLALGGEVVPAGCNDGSELRAEPCVLNSAVQNSCSVVG